MNSDHRLAELQRRADRLALLRRLAREALAGPLGAVEREELHASLTAYEAELRQIETAIA